MNIGMTMIAQMVMFALFIWVIATKIWPPLLSAIEERQKKIAEGLAAADRSKSELAQAEERVNEQLREARGKAAEIIAQAELRGNQIVDAAKQEAIAEGNRQKAAAQADIVAATSKAKEDLRKQVSVLAVAGAEKLIKREIDGNAHKALLDELAAEI
jgi:F-type H+-transporting ATPase subunit b